MFGVGQKTHLVVTDAIHSDRQTDRRLLIAFSFHVLPANKAVCTLCERNM